VLFAGCGVSKRSLEDAERRINVLKEKGVPDSSLSSAVVQLYQARDAKQRGNRGVAKKAADSMLVLIAQAEDQYEEDMKRLKPYVDSLKIVFRKTGAELSGLQRKHLDSLVSIVDSFYTMNWLLQAEAHANQIVDYLPTLKLDEEVANEKWPKVRGTWVCKTRSKHSSDKTVNAVEHKIFTFNGDSSALFVEKKSGKSTPYFKEDWEFRSWGKWGMHGDTIHVFVDRFAAVKQNFEEYHKPKEGGKPYWKKINHPSYDSTITDGSQNRYITLNDLKQDFVKR
jgi:hypothetical protein